YDWFDAPQSSIVKDGNGVEQRETKIEYDGLGRQTKLTDPTSGTRNYKYNAFGELRYVQDAIGTRNIVNDGLGRPTQSTDASDASKYEQYTWDTGVGSGVGKLAQTKSMPDNVIQGYSYTDLGQLYKRSLTVGSK